MSAKAKKEFIKGSVVMITLLGFLFIWLTSIGIFKVAYMPKTGVISSNYAQKNGVILSDWVIETSDGVKHGYATKP